MIKVIDFWAPWCGPCKVLGPIIESVQEHYDQNPDVEIEKVNVDENREMAMDFNVRGIPTVVIMKDGEVVKQFSGVKQKTEIVSLINEALLLNS